MTYQPTITLQEINKDIEIVKSAMLEHMGEANRLTIEQLTARIYGSFTENNRRKLRAVIHEINTDDSNNLIILTDTKNGGFWLADKDPSPAVTHYYEEESRAMNTLKKVKVMGHKIERLYGREALHPQPGQGRLL